jgi:predicted nucleotidyltransferase
MSTLAHHLRTARKSAGFTLQKVSQELGIDVAILSKIERGLRPVSQEQLKSLCHLYQIDFQHLVKMKSAEQILQILNYSEDSLEILKLAEQELTYATKKKITIEQIFDELNKILSKFKEIEKGWLFGSYARGEATIHSDVDIAIQAKKGFSYFQLADIQFQAEKKLNLKIDIGFLDSMEPKVKKEVSAEMKLFYEKPQIRIQFHKSKNH